MHFLPIGKSKAPQNFTVHIIEAYKDYKPFFDARTIVQELLELTPPKYLMGLDCIVLTNMSGLPHRYHLGKVRRENRAIPRTRIGGMYHPRRKGNKSYIEIYVDKAVRRPKWYFSFPICKKALLGNVLFHELGHHVHATIRPEHRNKEIVAEEWKGRFMGAFLRRRYWYLLPILYPTAFLYQTFKTRNRGR